MAPESTTAASPSPKPLPSAIAHPQVFQPAASTDIQPSPAIVTMTTRVQDHPSPLTPLSSPPILFGQKPLPFAQQASSQPLETITAPEPEPDATKPVRQIRKKKVHCLFHYVLELCCCSLPYYSVR